MGKTLKEQAQSIDGELKELRHSLHQEPELGLDLPLTQKKVIESLSGLGLSISEGEGLTSVTAVLRGSEGGPTVLLRGDMDALPLTEHLDLPYRSTRDGVMHACGHDLHTSMLVGAAHLLASRKDALKGNVVFMFQPGEEGFDGAGEMIKEGVLRASGELPSAAYAIHVMSSTWRSGTFASRPGAMMAASDGLAVKVIGAGGHGSAPHLAKDPIPAACEMVGALQTYLTRSIDAFEPVVVTVGSFHAGTKRNIIPESATFEATIRTFSPKVREQVAVESVRLCKSIGHAYGLEVEAEFRTEYPVTINDENEVGFVSKVVDEVFGAERLVKMTNPVTGAEDFSRVLNHVPGAMIFLGACPDDSNYTSAPNNHSPYASFSDDVLSDGAALYAELAVRRLEELSI
ncbi:hippurate hydrolase [Ferrithrix thermotolerans DSM 19514]|jgi:amidohydrolase|uniref:Hippurate hydrolase n=1 Tax=Ferrithrix thermotolerans DSM 19514 TaxID=1121881 RepID=A0A1M4U9G5_9ACTN|nr:M20 family metallopeptidase [Ferrithrix thermotolerans]SHE53379.1 hippurate hydrolase [Ferrithrix thermotolerans DSM 19514]